MLILILPLAVQGYRVFAGSNFHTLVPGRVYRCAQPTPAELEALVRTYGIRTIVNVRGSCDPLPWYLEECRVTHRLNVAQEDISFSAGRYPPTHELRRLVEVLDHCEYPILLHCRQGADRTGLAAVFTMLLEAEVSFAQARRQLSPCYGHFAVGRSASLDQYVKLYAEWLRQQGREHSRGAVREWIADPRCPGDGRCHIDVLEQPPTIPCGQPAAVRIRVENQGRRPWELRAASNAGVHAIFWLHDAFDNCVGWGRAGFFDAVVPPDSSVDLRVAFPALPPGTYRLRIDMVQEPFCYFYQVGAAFVEREVVVTP